MVSRHGRPAVVGSALLLVAIAVTAGIWIAHAPASKGNAASTAAAASTTLPGRWKLAFRDEFNGHRLNRHKWQPGWFGSGITAPVSSNDRQCYSSRQVTVAHGALQLDAVAKRTECGGTTYSYRSGIVSSNPVALGHGNGYAFKYGVVEFRVKVPGDGHGHCSNWSTVWTDGQSWPTDGEIDLLECLAGRASWYLHSDVPGGAYSVPGDSPASDWSGWHTFAVDWEPSSATLYWDGRRVGSHTYKVPHRDYLVVSNAIRKGSPAIVPARLKVDYVRVWQHSNAPGSVTVTLPTS